MIRPVGRLTGRGFKLRGIIFTAAGLVICFMLVVSPPALAGPQQGLLGIIGQNTGSLLILPVRHEDKAHQSPGDVMRHYQSQGQQPPKNYREKFEKRNYYRSKNYRKRNRVYRNNRRYYDYNSYYDWCDYNLYRCAEDFGYGSPPFSSCMAYNGCY